MDLRTGRKPGQALSETCNGPVGPRTRAPCPPVEDSPALTNDGRPKRWVVVRPPHAATGLLLARADGEDQAGAVGRQVAARVGFFLHVDDFDGTYRRMSDAGVQFVRPPRLEPYGRVAVFTDIAGNKWDLLGPA
jgi:hypothetical protein